MPGLAPNQVTLNDVLEVKGGPLNENELWAVLYQCCDKVKDIFLTGKIQHLYDVIQVLCPDNLILCGSGKIKFGYDKGTISGDKRFLPPENFMYAAEDISPTVLEKMFIYTLGMNIYAAAEYGANSVVDLCLSSEMETLLMYMCEDDPTSRCCLSQVLQACNSRKGIFLSGERIRSLVKSILGCDLPSENSPPSPTGFLPSSSSVVLRISNHPSDVTNSFSLASLQSLPPLNSTYADILPKDFGTPNGVKYSDVIDGKTSRDIKPTKINRNLSEERYEPLTKTHQHELEAEATQSAIQSVIQSAALSATQAGIQKTSQSLDEGTSSEQPRGDALEKLPPLDRVKPMTRDKNKSAYSTPNFKRAMTIEKKKLVNDGYLDEERSKIKVIDHRYKSMPALDTTDRGGTGAGVGSPQRSDKGSTKSAEYPYNQTGNLRKLTRFASRGSVDSESMATSMFSSTLSLNHGSYTLENQDRSLQRPLSLYSGSSIELNEDNYTRHFQKGSEHLAKGGPEFILIPNNEELAVVDITPARLGPIPRGSKKLSVLLPNAQKLKMLIEVSALAKDVFDQVTEHLGVKETVYFGLTQIKEGEHLFLDLDSKISKVAPSGWKDDKKNKIEFILHFKVKFFIGEVSQLKHYVTRHMFYLQLRREVLCSYIYCQDEAAIYLASLALQAEYGDYVAHHHGKCYFTPEHYLPGRILSRLSRSDIFHQLPLMHHSHRGVPESEAELRFIQECQHLGEYGLLFYQVSRSKKDLTDSILLGISVRGILLFELRAQMKTEIHRQQWHFIEKFVFRRKKFVVQPRKASGLPPLTLYTNSYKKSKYLLRMCQSFHRFSLLCKSRPVPKENAQKAPPIQDKKQEKYKETKPMNGFQARNKNSPDHEGRHADPDIKQQSPKQQSFSQQSVNQRSISPLSFNDESPKQQSFNHQSYNRPIKENASKADRVEGRHTNQARFQKQYSHDSNEFSPNVQRRLSSLPGGQDRKVKVIHLSRRPGQGLGITIVGGEDSKRLGNGIFIKSIHPDGLAGVEGSLQKGDRLISVNGQSLEQVTHERAAHLLTCASEEVDLIVSQMSPGSSFLDKSGLSRFEESEIKGTLDDPDMIEVKEYEKLRLTGPLKQQASLPLSPILSQTPKSTRQKQIKGDHDAGQMLRNQISEEEIIALNREDDEQNPSFDEEDHYTEHEYTKYHRMSKSNETEAQRNVNNLVEENGESIDECFLVELRKRKNSLGLVFMGGIGSGLPHNGIYVKQIEQNGAAYEDGRIQLGDRLIEASGISLEYVSFKQAMEVLKRIPSETTLLISRSADIHPEVLQRIQPHSETRTSSDRTSKRNQVMHDTFSVELEKGIGGLGLSLVGGKGSEPELRDQIMIRRLFPGQPAALCGKLRIGDVILSVNGQPLDGFSQQEAINLLRSAESKVQLIMRRPNPSDIPEELLMESPRGNLDPQSVLQNIQKKLSEQAYREMPPTPGQNYTSSEYDEKEVNKKDVHDIEDEIIPYSDDSEVKNVAEMNSILAEDNKPSRPIPGNMQMRKLSSNEIIVHAQIEKTNHKPDMSSQDEYIQETVIKDDGFPELLDEKPHSHAREIEAVKEREESGLNSVDRNKELAMSVNAKLLNSESEDYDAEFYSRFDSIGLSALRSDSAGNSQKIFKPIATENKQFDDAEKQKNQLENTAKRKGLKIEPSAVTPEIAVARIDEESDAGSHVSQDPKYEYIETVLIKGSTGLGFTLAGGKSTTGGCFIRDIVADPAKSNGKLKSGDQIVEVDSIDISNFEHMEAVDTLRNTSDSVHLKVKRKISTKKRKTKEQLKTKQSKYAVSSAEENSPFKIGHVSSGYETERSEISFTHGTKAAAAVTRPEASSKQGDIQSDSSAALPKNKKASVDSENEASSTITRPVQSLPRGDSFRSDSSRKTSSVVSEKEAPSAITRQLPSFARSDSLRSDSSATSSPKKSSVVNSPLLKRLDVLQDSSQNSQIRKTSSQEDKGEIILVQLIKGSSGLGMSLTGKNEFGHEAGAFVASINAGSVTERSGKLRKGDKLISINGENVDNKSQKDVVSILRNTGGKIDLEIFRFPHQPSSEIMNTSRPSSKNSNNSNIDLSDLISRISIEEKDIQSLTTPSEEPQKSGILKDDIVYNEEAKQRVEDRKEESLVTQTKDIENDLSWEDSELSEEDDFDDHLLELSSEASQMRNLKLALRETTNYDEQTNQDASVSFSSTFENVTPSSSILTSTLGEITPDEGEDFASEGSEFQDISPSLIPDLSSVQHRKELDGTIEGNLEGSFVKSVHLEGHYEANQIQTDEKHRNVDLDEKVKNENQYEQAGFVDYESRQADGKATKIVLGQKNSENDARDVHDFVNDNDDDNHDDDDDDGDVELSHEVIMDEKPDFSSELKSVEQPDIGLNISACSRDLFPSLQDKKNKNVTSKLEGMLDEHTDSRLNESRIPKLDPTTLMKHDREVMPKSKMNSRSGIPVRSPPRSPAKRNSIELKDKGKDTITITSKAHQMETSFSNDVGHFNADEAETRQFEDGVINSGHLESDYDDDDSESVNFDDDDFTLDLTGDTLTNSNEEINSRISHYQSILESDQIDKEFQVIKDMKPTDSCDVARRSVNRDKNRFRSILPYDKTRICLAGGEESDYINANRIKLNVNDIHGDYIAAQGPLPNTVADFWRMIWECKVDTIVMVTKDVEGGKVKCHRYWPDMPGLPMKVSDRFKVDLVHRKDHGSFIERQFSLFNLKANKSVTVDHFLFTEWPDVGIPKEPVSFLEFVKQTLAISSSGPLLVHCSAGTGRTGLFIIAHMINKLVTEHKNFEIVDIVKSLKRQRQSLLQTMDQYSFCYKMVVAIIKEEKHLAY